MTNQPKKKQCMSQKLIEKTEDAVAHIGLAVVVVTVFSVIAIKVVRFYILDKIKGK